MDRNEFFARTMHTPDDPVRASQRSTLREISGILIPLHRAVIDAARSDYSMMFEEVGKPTVLLQLVKEHPFFAWIRPLTALIVDIDQMVRVDFAPNDIAGISARMRRLFIEADEEFSSRYVPILQRDVNVAVAHGKLRRVMTTLEPGH
jgi:hypothetical protein